MFTKWLQENQLAEIRFDGVLFPTAADREFWSGCTGAEEIAQAEKYLNFNWPMLRASHFLKFCKEGDRLAYENPYFERRNALTWLLLGELAEYKGRFLPELCDGIFLVCEESYWGLSAHLWGRQLPPVDDPLIDLFASETAEFMAVLRYLMADALESYCPALLQRLDYELQRRIVKPYLNHKDFVWMGYEKRVNNWNPWILSNILTVFLLQVKDREVLNTGLEKMFTELDHYYIPMPEDGGCDEGPNYWDVAGGRVFAFCDRLFVFSLGKINFFQEEKLQKILQFLVHTNISGCRFANFADGSSRIMDNNDYILDVNGLRIGDPRLCALAASMKKAQAAHGPLWTRRLTSLCGELYGRIYAKEIDGFPAAFRGEVNILPDTQLAFFRNDCWYCAAKGGFNAESHNHNDVGSFMLYHEGQPVLIDPGCGVYRKETFQPALRYTIWTMQSCWHNLPTVNGQDQLFGKEYRADGFRLTGETVEISFANAYSPESGLSWARRTLALEETGLRLLDRFCFEKPQNNLMENFMTPLVPVVTEKGVLLGEKFLLSANIPYEITIDRQEIAQDKKLFADWQTEALYRLRFAFVCETEENIEFTLQVV